MSEFFFSFISEVGVVHCLVICWHRSVNNAVDSWKIRNLIISLNSPKFWFLRVINLIRKQFFFSDCKDLLWQSNKLHVSFSETKCAKDLLTAHQWLFSQQKFFFWNYFHNANDLQKKTFPFKDNKPHHEKPHSKNKPRIQTSDLFTIGWIEYMVNDISDGMSSHTPSACCVCVWMVLWKMQTNWLSRINNFRMKGI